MSERLDILIGNEHRRICGIGQGLHYPVMSGVVTAVDSDGMTCTVQLTADAVGSPTDGILLNVITDNTNGMNLVPAVNAHCVVAEVDGPGQLKQLLWASEYTKIKGTAGSSQFTVENDLIQFNDGSLDGMVKVAALKTKLNNLENLVNDLVTKFNSHTHILTLTMGTGTAAPTVAPETTTLTPTVQADIENTKITQG